MMLYKRFQRIIELTRHLEALAGRHPEGFSPKDFNKNVMRFFAPLRMTNGMQNCQHAYVAPSLRMTNGDFAQNYIINV